MALDTNQTNPGYLCGRLLAALEALEAATLPEKQRTVFYQLLPKLATSPGVAITAIATHSPNLLNKLANRDPAAAELHKNRIGDILSRITTPNIPVDLETRSWAALGYHHQEHADVAAGLRPDQDHPITTDEVADMLGYQGDSATKTAATWLARHGIKPIGRQPGRYGLNTYSYAEVLAAKQSAPGRGARTDLAAKAASEQSD